MSERIAIALVGGGGVALLAFALLVYAWAGRLLRRRRIGSFGNDLVAELGRKFESGIDTVQSTERGMYELPWYVLVGEPGAGKTEAIRHSGIGFLPGLNEPAQGRGGTVNMDWWLAKKAILLDTAGRLMFEATEEWLSFLQLLKQHRPHTPINGMILAIPVTSLQSDEPAQIAEKAAQIAAQLDAVQQTLDVRFPVYVLITKADKIGGFREFFHNLAQPSMQNQLLGWSNPAELDEVFDASQIGTHLAAVADRLRRRRLALLADPRTVVEHADRLAQVDALYAFPTELTRLAPRLGLYLESIFGTAATPATRALFLRGVYFTSAMSEGAALDVDLAESMGLDATRIPENLRIFEREKSYFLRDFFLDKCFPEGGLVTGAANVARSLRRRRAATVICAALAAAALLAASMAAYRAMQRSAGEHAAFWSAIAARQRVQPALDSGGRGTSLAWFQLFDPGTGAYRGDQPLGAPYPPDATVADLHRQAQALALRDVQVPWMFRMWDRARRTGLNADRRDAHRLLAERGIYQPLMAAAMARVSEPGLWSQAGPAATAAAIADLARFAAGSSAAGINVDPIYQIVLGPTDRDAFFRDFADRSLAPLQALERGAGRPWPPAIGGTTDLAAVAARGLVLQAQTLELESNQLSAVVDALNQYHATEQQLLALAPGFQRAAHGSADVDPRLVAQWRRDVASLAEMNVTIPGLTRAIAARAGNQSLETTYRLLQREEKALLAQCSCFAAAFAGPAGNPVSVTLLDAAQRQAEQAARDGFAASDISWSGWAPGASAEEALRQMGQDYFDAASRSDRLDAYQAELIDLSRAAPALARGWHDYAAAVGNDAPARPTIELADTTVNRRARQLIQAAAAYALGRRQSQLAAAAVDDLPTTPAGWGDAVAVRAAGEPPPAMPPALPPVPLAASTEPPPAADSPGAATAVATDFSRFVQAWNAQHRGAASDAQNNRIASARAAFDGYSDRYLRVWRAAASDVRVMPMRWEQVVAAGNDQTLPDAAAAGIAARGAAANRAISSLAAVFAGGGDHHFSLETAAFAPPSGDSEEGLQIWAQWRQIIQPGGDPGEARRRLLSLDRRTLGLLFCDIPQTAAATPQVRYWKQASAQFLAALRGAAPATGQHAAASVAAQLASFPLVAWSPDAATLTVDQVDALRDRAEAGSAVLAGAAQDPNSDGAIGQADVTASFPDSVRADFLALRDGPAGVAGGDDVGDFRTQFGHVTPVLWHLLAPRSPIAVNLYLLPLAQQSELEAGAGAKDDSAPSALPARWPAVEFAAQAAGKRQSSEADSIADLAAATQLYHTAFPIAGESASLQLLASTDAGAPGAVCALAGGPWWPLVALHDGHAQPAGGGGGAGPRRFWYVRLWAVDVATQHRWPMWIGLDFGTEVDPAQLWPSQP